MAKSQKAKAEADAKTAAAQKAKAEADAKIAADKRATAEALAAHAIATNETRQAELRLAENARLAVEADTRRTEAENKANDFLPVFRIEQHANGNFFQRCSNRCSHYRPPAFPNSAAL